MAELAQLRTRAAAILNAHASRQESRAPRPILGVLCCTRRIGGEPAQAVIDRYVAAATRFADASALLIPSLAGAAEAHDVAPHLDGLLLTGSPSNVEPHRYGVADPAAEGPFDPQRDTASLAFTRAMLELGKPVFGVCRGLQELNVAFGGDLRRDLGGGAHPHHAPAGADLDALFAHGHEVALAPAGVLARSLDRARMTVNSVHYQGIARLGAGLFAEAWSPDGVIEAVSAQVGAAAVLAVQWHPEWNPEHDPGSAAFFRILGRALRRQPLAPDPGTQS